MDEKQLLQAIAQMMDSKLEPINKRLDAMDQRFTKIEIILENDVKKSLNLLAEGHHDTVEKLKQLDTLTEKVDEIQDIVDVLKVLTIKK
ncbi:MAG: DUF5320 domain-containing protein [Clostridiales bacterium]|jgi:iron-sulfur cluster repair protein YtfE (RIC family)|nr:DUF5320 domain-containing protein [Clostridiales bacterium]